MRNVILILTIVFSSALQAQTGEDPPEISSSEPLVVGTREAVPFAMRAGDEWTGMSIDLWNEIANEAGIEFRYVERDLDGLISGVETNDLDLAVSALTITEERERRVDFSHPYYASGLGIAVKSGAKDTPLVLVRALFSKQLLKTLGMIILVAFVVGALVWLFERRRNPDQFGGSAREGLWSGLWWSAVTMTTVGYGDKSPVTSGGRIIALVWMVAGLIAISTLTASMASALTLNELQGSIDGPEDLPGVTVGTVSGSTSNEWLTARAIRHRGFSRIEEALDELSAGELDAVVYDSPILRYMSRHRFEDLRVLDQNLGLQTYGIAFPSGSPLREPVNRKILELIEGEEFRAIRIRYLGDEEQ
ncbi:MAG: transporter substrate-binding domain-containing protein [Acidobacteria bacterium]|nr:transporter substrate-binding domain-containing protein [Acidobacteriota bacterium]